MPSCSKPTHRVTIRDTSTRGRKRWEGCLKRRVRVGSWDGEVAAAGLNAIREICVRQPLAMNDTLLQDLVMYKKSKDKGVMMASKGLLGLYRQVGAEMLRKRDRGRDATIGLKSGEQAQQRFGEFRQLSSTNHKASFWRALQPKLCAARDVCLDTIEDECRIA